MKYYSEKTNKIYNTTEALKEAEAKMATEEREKKLKDEQKDARWKEVQEAKQRYFELKEKFEQDYFEEIYGGLFDKFFWY